MHIHTRGTPQTKHTKHTQHKKHAQHAQHTRTDTHTFEHLTCPCLLSRRQLENEGSALYSSRFASYSEHQTLCGTHTDTKTHRHRHRHINTKFTHYAPGRSGVCVCVCVCVCVHARVHVLLCKHTDTYLYRHRHIQTHVSPQSSTQTCISLQLYTHTDIYTQAYACIQTCVYRHRTTHRDINHHRPRITCGRNLCHVRVLCADIYTSRLHTYRYIKQTRAKYMHHHRARTRRFGALRRRFLRNTENVRCMHLRKYAILRLFSSTLELIESISLINWHEQ
jgi:hypothetical protein